MLLERVVPDAKKGASCQMASATEQDVIAVLNSLPRRKYRLPMGSHGNSAMFKYSSLLRRSHPSPMHTGTSTLRGLFFRSSSRSDLFTLSGGQDSVRRCSFGPRVAGPSNSWIFTAAEGSAMCACLEAEQLEANSLEPRWLRSVWYACDIGRYGFSVCCPRRKY